MGGAGGHTGDRVAQTADTAAVEDVLLVVLPEAPNPFGFQGSGTVQNPFDEYRQLAQTDPAGGALAAGLRMTQPQKVQRHIHRAQPRLAGVDPPLHISG